MIEFVAAIFGGAAANQLDEPLKSFDRGWELIARYMTGVLTAEVFFAMMLRGLNRSALRDALLAFNGAFAARIFKDLTSK